ncbi:MAG: glycosyl hydrolase [Acidobacteria bacterium]|nr:MAG: glycosyl hydrolase [Acidobacteriota bacterium]
MKPISLLTICMFFSFHSPVVLAKKKSDLAEPSVFKDVSLSGLKFRSIGPAVTGGRIAAIAVNPNDSNTYYIGSGHGNLWKTVNSGTTFSPVFDNQKAYAIGAIAIDPSNPNVVWVGTGENNCQNNVGYGDGVYRSQDGGKTWKNMGLKESEHIGGIVIHPQNSNVVFVAAYGPQRASGGERGIYKTIDGGKTWKRVLHVSDHTGFFQIHMDPRNPDILYGSANQRMRKHYTNIWGGPESGIYRTTDGGANWEKLTNGLPEGDMGRIGMAISPANPDIVYAIIHASPKSKGFYKSTDRGMSWTKQSDYISSYPFYFQQIVADPINPDRVYSMDVFMQVTEDGGKTWKRAGSKHKHVDDHCMWIDPANNNHLIAGCDGGLYESYDRARNWIFKSNIPITEIYKVTTDNAKPFYHVYIGTQDNNSLTGPSRTLNSSGITNQDWIFTNSGDGFETQVDWKDPNIIYAQSQYGGLARYDKRSGENLFIKPQDFADSAYRFDWDAALLISRHDHKTLYFGGNKVLKTTDRGSTWQEISPDLTRGVPLELEALMGQSWSIDQLVSKGSTANVVTIAESPINANRLFAGSGDGLIHYTTDGGQTWQKSSVPGLPEYARVHHIIASNFDENTAYAACHDMNGGDYRPYLYKTTDGGQSWVQMNGNLPKRGSTYTIAEDHVDRNLLFVGTQFGVFFTIDGGGEWIQLKSGIPTHCIMDIDIQREENDLVVSTFGRGVYILDDYTPLRFLNKELIDKEAALFPVKTAKMYVEANSLGYRGVGSMGAGFFSAPNPKVGAVFTYYLKNDFKSLKEQRREKEKKLQKEGKSVKHPSYETLLAEEQEPASYLLFTISDEKGQVVRKLKQSAKKGVNRLVWDFRTDPASPVSLKAPDTSIPWNEPDQGYMVVPGTYTVSLSKFEKGTFTDLASPVSFQCEPLNVSTLPAKDKAALDAFNQKVAELARVVQGADSFRASLEEKMAYLKKASLTTPGIANQIMTDISAVEADLKQLNRDINGDVLRVRFEGASPTSVSERMALITWTLWSTTAAPTTTFIKSYDVAASQVQEILISLKTIEARVLQIEEKLEKAGAPYTPDRFPSWKQ